MATFHTLLQMMDTLHTEEDYLRAPLQTYTKSMEYPPKFGRNANLKLGIK